MNEANRKLGNVDENLIRSIGEELRKLQNDYENFKEDNANNI